MGQTLNAFYVNVAPFWGRVAAKVDVLVLPKWSLQPLHGPGVTTYVKVIRSSVPFSVLLPHKRILHLLLQVAAVSFGKDPKLPQVVECMQRFLRPLRNQTHS